MRGAKTIAANSAETMNELLDMLNSRMSFLLGCLALELPPAAEASANSLRGRAFLWRMEAMPMLGYMPPGAEPDAIAPAGVFEKTDEAHHFAGASNQTVVQADAHQLGRFSALLVHQVECVDHVAGENRRWECNVDTPHCPPAPFRFVHPTERQQRSETHFAPIGNCVRAVVFGCSPMRSPSFSWTTSPRRMRIAEGGAGGACRYRERSHK